MERNRIKKIKKQQYDKNNGNIGGMVKSLALSTALVSSFICCFSVNDRYDFPTRQYLVKKAEQDEGIKASNNTWSEIKKHLKDENSIVEVYELGRDFKKNNGPLFKENEEESLNAASLCFIYIINKWGQVSYSQLDDVTRENLSKSYNSLGVIHNNVGMYERAYAYFDAASHLRLEEGTRNTKRVIGKIHKINTKEADCFRNLEQYTKDLSGVLDEYNLALKLENEISEAIENKNPCNTYAFCLTNILQKFNPMFYHLLNKETKILLSKVHYDLGLFYLKIDIDQGALEYLFEAERLGSKEAKKCLESLDLNPFLVSVMLKKFSF